MASELAGKCHKEEVIFSTTWQARRIAHGVNKSDRITLIKKTTAVVFPEVYAEWEIAVNKYSMIPGMFLSCSLCTFFHNKMLQFIYFVLLKVFATILKVFETITTILFGV